jgi:hypothetical protein
LPDAEVHFSTRVWPLFQERCLACHGEDPAKLKGGLDMRDRAGVLRGGDSGSPAVVAGQPEESPLYLAVLRTHQDWSAMPPKENDKLSEGQAAALKQWIKDGAAWPDDARRAELAKQAQICSAADGVRVKTSGGQAESGRTGRTTRPVCGRIVRSCSDAA